MEKLLITEGFKNWCLLVGVHNPEHVNSFYSHSLRTPGLLEEKKSGGRDSTRLSKLKNENSVASHPTNSQLTSPIARQNQWLGRRRGARLHGQDTSEQLSHLRQIITLLHPKAQHMPGEDGHHNTKEGDKSLSNGVQTIKSIIRKLH